MSYESDYRVITGTSDSAERAVSDALKKGWALWGAPQHTLVQYPNGEVVSHTTQTVVLRNHKPDEDKGRPRKRVQAADYDDGEIHA